MLNYFMSVNFITKARLAATRGTDPVLLLVPDRWTLGCEKLLLDGAKSILNVRVVTFSMLYNLLSGDLGEQPPVLDKQRAVLFLWKAIREVKPNLQWFNKSCRHHNFAERMFNTLNQLTSSMVDFEKLAPVSKKFHDICIIYKRYKKLVADWTDSSSMLGWLIKNICLVPSIKSTQIFITGFEHLSIQRLAVIEQLKIYAKSVQIEVRTKNVPKNITAVTYQTSNDEVEAIANKVRGLLNDCISPNEITVLLADFDNLAQTYETIFNESNIPTNIDTGKPLLEIPSVRFAMDVVALAVRESAENFLSVARNIFTDEEFFELEKNVLITNKFPKFDPAVMLRKQKTVPNMVKVLQDFTTEEKFREILNNLSVLCPDLTLTIREFQNLLLTITGAVKFSTVPTFANRVLVAPLSDWHPHSVDYLFVANTVDGNFPAIQPDTDILTIQDIRAAKVTIEPTAKQQNRRNLEHCLNVLSSAEKELFVSHIATGDESEIFEKLKKNYQSDTVNTPRFAKHLLLHSVDNGSAFLDPIYYGSLLESIGQSLSKDVNKEISVGEKIFLPNNKTSVTTLDSFQTCPMCCFLEKGLKLKRRELSKAGANIIGSILHKIIEVGSIESVLARPEFKYFVDDPKNAPLVAVLKREAKMIIQLVKEQIQSSEFKPVCFEKKLGGKIANVNISGIADRIDQDELGRKLIIDYKTGKVPSGTGGLQLPLYMHFTKDSVGAVYFPLTSGFGKDRKLRGMVPDKNWDNVVASAVETAADIIETMKAGQITDCICGRLK